MLIKLLDQVGVAANDVAYDIFKGRVCLDIFY